MAGRAIQDQSLTANVTFGNVNFTVCTAGIDLGAVTPFPVTDSLTVQIVTSAATNAANSKNVNITLQDSNVNLNANFTAMGELTVLVIPSNTVTNIHGATTRNVALPPSVRQFIRAVVTGQADGGNTNDGVCTLRLAF